MRLGQTLGVAELVTLFSARGPEVAAIAELADELRRDAVGDDVTFVRNRNINYTNVCTFKCRFCGFSKGPLSLNLRGTPYLLTLDDIAERTAEAWAAGATEVCLQVAATTPTMVAQAAVEAARWALDADISWCGFLQGDTLVMGAYSGFRNPGIADVWSLGLGQGIGGRVAAEGRTITIRDYLRDPRRVPVMKKVIDDEGIRGVICAPLVSDPLLPAGSILGVLYVAVRRPNTFSRRECELVSALARDTGVRLAAVYREAALAQERDETREHNEALEQRLRILADLADTYADTGELASGLRVLAAHMGGGVALVDQSGTMLGKANDIVGDAQASVAVQSGSVELGRMEVSRDRPFDRGDLELLDHARRIVTLELLRERSTLEAELRLHGELLDDLLHGNVPDEAAIVRRAALLGFDIRQPAFVACLGVHVGRPAEHIGADTKRLGGQAGLADRVAHDVVVDVEHELLVHRQRERQGQLRVVTEEVGPDVRFAVVVDEVPPVPLVKGEQQVDLLGGVFRHRDDEGGARLVQVPLPGAHQLVGDAPAEVECAALVAERDEPFAVPLEDLVVVLLGLDLDRLLPFPARIPEVETVVVDDEEVDLRVVAGPRDRAAGHAEERGHVGLRGQVHGDRPVGAAGGPHDERLFDLAERLGLVLRNELAGSLGHQLGPPGHRMDLLHAGFDGEALAHPAGPHAGEQLEETGGPLERLHQLLVLLPGDGSRSPLSVFQ